MISPQSRCKDHRDIHRETMSKFMCVKFAHKKVTQSLRSDTMQEQFQ
jgi:hypothetical protein